MPDFGGTDNSQQALEPDSYSSSDQDSAYGGDSISGSLTSSLTSSIYKYRKNMDGRRRAYKDREYESPKDGLELDRLGL
jgi:hypothetical protein